MSVFRGLRLFALRMSSVEKKLCSKKNLVYTNVGISMSAGAVASVLEQRSKILKGKSSGWFPKQIAYETISEVPFGLLFHYWYKFLDAKFPGKTVKIVLKKVAVEQLIVFTIAFGIFAIVCVSLEEKDWPEWMTGSEIEYHVLAECIGFILSQMINFYFVPTRFRVLYEYTAFLGYDIYTRQVEHKH